MTAIILKRILQGVFVLFLLSLIVFIGSYAVGDPIDSLVSDYLTDQEKRVVITELGLDKPKSLQYIIFLKNFVTGNFGKSFVTGESVTKMFFGRLPATIELSLVAVLIAATFGITIGLYAGLKPRSKLSQLGMASMAFSFSVPIFWIAMLCIMIFSVKLSLFPPGRRGDTISFLGLHSSLFSINGIRHLMLPAFCLSLNMMSLLARMTRTAVMETIQQDHVLFAKAKGVTTSRILIKHVLRNILIPLVTASGTQIANIIAFASVIETIFNWPGIGKLLIDSIYALDRPVILVQIMFTGVLFIAINLVVDVLYAMLDPRIRDMYTRSGDSL